MLNESYSSLIFVVQKHSNFWTCQLLPLKRMKKHTHYLSWVNIPFTQNLSFHTRFWREGKEDTDAILSLRYHRRTEAAKHVKGKRIKTAVGSPMVRSSPASIYEYIFILRESCGHKIWIDKKSSNTQEFFFFPFEWSAALQDLESTLKLSYQFSSVKLLSHVQLFATPWTAACQASLSITNLQSLPKLMSIDSVMPFNHLILCHPLLLLPSIFPSIRACSNESALYIRWPKYWSFSFNISPSSEYPRLMSFRMDRLDLLAVQGTLKSLLQHHSSKTSILWHSAFFTVQLSHPHMTTGKTIALTRWTFAGKVISLFFNMLSRLVITSLPRSKHLLFIFFVCIF